MINTLLAILIAALAGSNAMAFGHDPEGTPPTVEARMVALYDAAARDVNEHMARAARELAADPQRRAPAFRQMRAARLAHDIEARLARLGQAPRSILRDAGVVAVAAAVRRGDEEIRKLGLEVTPGRVGTDGLPVALGVSFGAGADDAVRRIAEDTAFRAADEAAGAMAVSIDQHGRRAVQVFRSLSESDLMQTGGERAVNLAIARGVISGDPRLTDRAVRDLFRDPNSPEAESLRKLGNRQVTVGKATMSVRQYAATVTRTRMREATVHGRHARLSERGIRLVQITGRVSDNFCTDYLGLVCSLDGSSGSVGGVDYIALAGLPGGGPPFHPNCSKGTAAFIPELVSDARLRFARAGFATYSNSLSA